MIKILTGFCIMQSNLWFYWEGIPGTESYYVYAASPLLSGSLQLSSYEAEYLSGITN